MRSTHTRHDRRGGSGIRPSPARPPARSQKGLPGSRTLAPAQEDLPGEADPRMVHTFNRGRRAANKATVEGRHLRVPNDLSGAEREAWLKGFEYQMAIWNAPPPEDEGSGSGT